MTIRDVLEASRSIPNAVLIDEYTEPYVELIPDRLTFTVILDNELERVFRGHGTVLQFTVAGRIVPIENTLIDDFLKSVVPPGSQSAFHISGPPLAELPDHCDVGILLYDVATEVDDAGNVVRRQNFEWHFQVRMATRQEVAERTRVRKFVLPHQIGSETRYHD